MLDVNDGIEVVAPVKRERNVEVKNEIRETLENMAPGQSFVLEGKVKKNMVKVIAIAADIRIRIAKGTDEKLRCWRL